MVAVQYVQLSAGGEGTSKPGSCAIAPSAAHPANAAMHRPASRCRRASRKNTTNSSGVSLVAAATPTGTPR